MDKQFLSKQHRKMQNNTFINFGRKDISLSAKGQVNCWGRDQKAILPRISTHARWPGEPGPAVAVPGSIIYPNSAQLETGPRGSWEPEAKWGLPGRK